jgi:hypothetical protein
MFFLRLSRDDMYPHSCVALSAELIDFCEFVWCLQFMAGVVYREAGILFM